MLCTRIKWSQRLAPRALGRHAVSVLPALILLPIVAGCAVPQPRGGGQLALRGEPTTSRGYWLYLPRQYVQADEQARSSRRWPVVVSFHGMPPFDGAHAQALEWEQEADRYGFIVVAPRLRSPGVLSSFRSVGSALESDEEATLRVLDDVFATTRADRSNVLSTSWSSGGYVAHYMLNHHPDRFTCLAVRQSNYSESIMDAGRVPESLRHPVLVLAAQHDFGIVKRETRRAIEWYERNQYVNFAWVEIKGLGHERTPDMAAAFFARFAGVEPNEPPAVLARRQAIGGNPRGLALLSGDDQPVESSMTSASALPATPNVQRPAVRPQVTPSDRTERPRHEPRTDRNRGEPAATHDGIHSRIVGDWHRSAGIGVFCGVSVGLEAYG